MDWDKNPWEKLNKVLTFAAVVILMIWLWKRFGPAGGTTPPASGTAALSSGGLFSAGIAVSCGGYLLWRFLDWLFWRKYFHDKPPPDEPLK